MPRIVSLDLLLAYPLGLLMAGTGYRHLSPDLRDERFSRLPADGTTEKPILADICTVMLKLLSCLVFNRSNLSGEIHVYHPIS